MPAFNVADITQIARDVVSRQSLPVTVLGTVLSGGGSNYVEVLVRSERCANSPCKFAIGVLRNA